MLVFFLSSPLGPPLIGFWGWAGREGMIRMNGRRPLVASTCLLCGWAQKVLSKVTLGSK